MTIISVYFQKTTIMRKPWQIAQCEKAFDKLKAKEKRTAIEKALIQFDKKVKDRVKPEELLIRVISGV